MHIGLGLAASLSRGQIGEGEVSYSIPAYGDGDGKGKINTAAVNPFAAASFRDYRQACAVLILLLFFLIHYLQVYMVATHKNVKN